MNKNRKVILLTLFTMALFFQSIVFADIIAMPTKAKVIVDGEITNFEAYSIGGSNYFKLKDIAFAVNGSDKQFAVNWDGNKKVIHLISGAQYTPVGSEMALGDGKNKNAVVNTSSIYKDGVLIQLTAYTIGGNNFFKLIDLAHVFNIDVTWDAVTKTVAVTTSNKYKEILDAKSDLPPTVETYDYTYWGEVIGDEPHGQGKMYWKDGDIYIGGFLNGFYNGHGTYYWSDGDIYSGGFLDGYFSGQGTYTWSDGDKYVGEWLLDLKDGQGTYFWASGKKYVGEWSEDKQNGQGTYSFPSGENYVGEFLNNYYNGQGTYTYTNGDVYVGEWVDDFQNGLGIYTFTSGNKYVGEFLDDTFHGRGAEYDRAGNLIREGIYEYGVFVQ